MFTLEQVSKRHGSTFALERVDLVIRAARTTALIGPSGAGKSSLLRLLVGLDWPDVGRIRFDGKPLRRDSLLEHRRRIGYVIQDGGLFPHLSAFDNIVLLARDLGWPLPRQRQRCLELAQLCQLPPDALDRFPVQLSGGQRQRVGLIRALMLEPRVLLLDEPLAALDPIVRNELQDQLKQLFARLGKTVVLITHDIAEAAYLADELVLLRGGTVVQSGSVQQLLQNPVQPFVPAFLTAQRSLVVAG